jgi:class 3 adenylate cyclase
MSTSLRQPVRWISFRPVIWAFHLALPLAGLWLLLGNPGIDLRWQDHVAHFWIVLVTALISLALAVVVAIGAQRHDDARLYLVALGFTAASSFLALHAFATPDVVLTERSAAFNLATPIGVTLAGGFAVVAAMDMTPSRAERVMAWRIPLAFLVAALLAFWAVLSLAPASPVLDVPPDVVSGWLRSIALLGIALYAVAVTRSIVRYRNQRASVVLLSIITAQVLLAESLVAMAAAPNWHLSWWLWHVLMAIAFAYIAYAAHVEYRREGAAGALFTSLVAGETLQRMRDEYATALDQLVASIETAGSEPDGPGGARVMRTTVEGLRDRFGISEGQADVLEEAAATLAEERLESRRLGALVDVGRQARLAMDEGALIEAAQDRLQDAFPGDRITIARTDDAGILPPSMGDHAARAIVSSSMTEVEGDGRHSLAIPLRAGERVLGVLAADRPSGSFSIRTIRILESAANQLAVVMENGRLYRQVERLFRSYLSPDVVRTLLADPSRAGLGGASTEVTVLFADLRGFTPFSVGADPAAVVELLNRYFGAVVPIILREGGTVTQFVGDAIMAIFNAPAPQPDHPLRAARAALAMQAAIDALAIDGSAVAGTTADLPRFRVGIETGPVLVGNIGAAEVRTYTAIGETTNLAARLQTFAEVGRVVVGPVTATRLGGMARLRRLGPVELKGFPDAIEAYELLRLEERPDGP